MRLIYIAIGWAAGIVLAANNTSGSSSATLIWLGLVGMAAAAAWLAWPDDGLRRVMIALVAFTLGGLRMSLVPVSSEIAAFNNSGGLTIEGIIADEPDVRDDQTQIRVVTESITRAGQTTATSGMVLVRAPRSANIRFGDRVAATGLLVAPAEFDTFSYADFLGRSGVFSIMQDAAVEVLERNPVDKLRAGLYDFKAHAAQHIARSLPEPQAGLLTGILIGNDNGIAPEVADAFSRVGASHIIAISGFNMAVLSAAIMALLKRLRVPDRRAAIVSIGVIFIYTMLVGAGAAVVRAALMSSLLVIGTAIKRKTYVPASLAFVALILSLLNPTVLWDISFQLSFFATLGLALFADPLTKRFDAVLNNLLPPSLARTLGGFLSEPLIVTLAVQITTLPLIALYFSRLSLIVVLSNLLIVPVQAAVLILGILATLIAFVVPVLAQVLYWYDLILLSWTTTVVRLLARLPFADIEFFVDPRLIVLYFAILIGGALMQATQPTWALQLARFVRQRAVASATLFSGFATACLVGAVFFSRPDGKLHLWLLDVGHSNAALLQTPGGAQILVDGGRFPSRLLTSIGDRLPFNDQEIEALVITQPDENEYAALPAVLNRYDVGVVLTNGWQNLYLPTAESDKDDAVPDVQPVNLSESFTQLQQALGRTQVVAATAGYTLTLSDGVSIEVLHPPQPFRLGDSFNDTALVPRVNYHAASFLLTSDVSMGGQEAILTSSYWPLATVLQLPQHGTARSLSSDFLRAVQPQVAVLHSDRANQRGDPNADTLALLGDVPLLRTDQGGTIHLWTDGDMLWTSQA